MESFFAAVFPWEIGQPEISFPFQGMTASAVRAKRFRRMSLVV
jgi:hypothetical protein